MTPPRPTSSTNIRSGPCWSASPPVPADTAVGAVPPVAGGAEDVGAEDPGADDVGAEDVGAEDVGEADGGADADAKDSFTAAASVALPPLDTAMTQLDEPAAQVPLPILPVCTVTFADAVPDFDAVADCTWATSQSAGPDVPEHCTINNPAPGVKPDAVTDTTVPSFNPVDGLPDAAGAATADPAVMISAAPATATPSDS